MSTSRRSFLIATTAALVSSSFSWTSDAVPNDLDHIILACADLDLGIGWLEDKTGVRAKFSGVHPGRGTRNALLALGARRYLEVLAPDPAQASHPVHRELQKLKTPELAGWAVHVNAATAAERLEKAKIEFTGPTDGSRKRPDGKTLRWKTLNLKNDFGGLLPFFIQWSTDSLHPSVDSPQGCTLLDFYIAAPNTMEVAQVLNAAGVDANVRREDKPQLHARIRSAKGEVELS